MIGPVIAATLPLMRSHAESLMFDVCDVHRLTTAWDEALQKTTTTWTVVATDVPCALEEPPVGARELLTSEAVTPTTPTLHAPVSLSGVLPDDRVTFTAIGPLTDPGVAGAVLWVTHVIGDTHPVERLIECRWVR